VALEHRRIVLSVPAKAPPERKQAVLESWYRSEMKSVSGPLVAKWERQLDLSVKRFYVQKMKTKWGSSNPAP
jgi:predicted metal-dependent hydrolase